MIGGWSSFWRITPCNISNKCNIDIYNNQYVKSCQWKTKLWGLAILDVTLTRAMSHYLWLTGNSNISTLKQKITTLNKTCKSIIRGMGNAKVGGDEYTKNVRVMWTLCERSKTKFWKFFVMWILKDAHHEEGIESLGT